MANLPHFQFPFRLSPMGSDVVEQDTVDEIAQNVQLVLMTEQGSRVELPNYGIPSQVFLSNAAVPKALMQAQCERWEPRAATAIEALPSLLDDAERVIRARVSIGG